MPVSFMNARAALSVTRMLAEPGFGPLDRASGSSQRVAE